MGHIIFTRKKIVDYRSVFRADRAKGRRCMLGLFENGIFLNPLWTKLYLWLAHSDNDIDAFLEIAHDVLRATEST